MTFINRLSGYKLVFAPSAQKSLNALSNDVASSITNKLQALVCGANNLDVKKLQTNDQRYRLRVGDYRVVYMIEDKNIVVYVIDIGHRREIYRGG